VFEETGIVIERGGLHFCGEGIMVEILSFWNRSDSIVSMTHINTSRSTESNPGCLGKARRKRGARC
jgi:hypothetical protein